MKPLSLAELDGLPRYVGWRNELRNGKPTKVPYDPTNGRMAQSDNPITWGSKQAAEQWATRNVNGNGGGIGIMLGDLGDGRAIGGIDYDTCRDEGGAFTDWALEGIRRFGTYAEVSPSKSGAKGFFLYDPTELPMLREWTGSTWGKMWKVPNAGDHPPAIELHFGNRYFALTAEKLDTGPAELRLMPHEALRWIIEEAGPALTGKSLRKSPAKTLEAPANSADLEGRIKLAAGRSVVLARRLGGDWGDLHDGSRSGMAFALGAALKAAGFSFSDMCAALALHKDTAEWTADKGRANRGRELRRIYDNAPGANEPEPWGTPDMSVLGSDRRAPPALKLDLFGKHWAPWIAGPQMPQPPRSITWRFRYWPLPRR